MIGITYIKFSRASEAARATEEMHGQPLNERLKLAKPLEVYVTPRRSEINKLYVPDDKIYRKMLHLFVSFDRRTTHAELTSMFEVKSELFHSFKS